MFFLLCGRHRLKAAMWLVPIQRSFRIVSVPSGKLTGWLARLWLSTRRIENTPARKWRHPRRRLLDLQSLTAWGPRPPRLIGLWHRSRPFELALEGPSTTIPGKQEVWQGFFVYLYQTTLTGPRWGLAWQALPRTGGVCWATAGPPASSRTGWALLSSNGLSSPIKASVSGPGTAVRTFSKQSMTCWWREPSRGSPTWRDFCDAYLHVPMHQAVRKYLRFVVNKKVYQFTCLPCGLATYPREFTKLLRTAVSLFRQQGVKLHVYLDDWLIRADTPEQA